MVDDSNSWDYVEALIESLETENGRPVILSRYGYRIIEIDGKNYLVAATKEELVDQLLKHQAGYTRDEVLGRIPGDTDPGCSGCWPKCTPFNGCKTCKKAYIGDKFFYCECKNT